MKLSGQYAPADFCGRGAAARKKEALRRSGELLPVKRTVKQNKISETGEIVSVKRMPRNLLEKSELRGMKIKVIGG